MSTVNQRINEDGGPWYKQFWAWFIFTPLIVVVLACSVFVTIAFKTRDDVVIDDYYKVGKMINQEFQPSAEAKALGLVASLNIGGTSRGDSIDVTLNESSWLAQDSLLLNLSHPVEAKRDHFLTLKRVDTLTWRTELKSDLDGRWYLRLSALDDDGGEEWRMQGEIALGSTLSTQLR